MQMNNIVILLGVLCVSLGGCYESSDVALNNSVSGSDYSAPLNREEFITLSERAEKGDGQAAYRISRHFLSIGKSQDDKTYQHWLRKADELGDMEANQFLIGYFLNNGECAAARERLKYGIGRFTYPSKTISDIEKWFLGCAEGQKSDREYR